MWLGCVFLPVAKAHSHTFPGCVEQKKPFSWVKFALQHFICLEILRISKEPSTFGVISSTVSCIWWRVWPSGTSVPALWRVSTSRQERLVAGAALSALLLQSMLGTTLHCTGQRWHGSWWVGLNAFIKAPFSATRLKMPKHQKPPSTFQFNADFYIGQFSDVISSVLRV